MKEKELKEVKLGKYIHYKGKFYEVIGTGHHSETFEELVFYRALFTSPEFGPNALWARPKKMFSEEVEILKDGKKVRVPRFKFIDPAENF